MEKESHFSVGDYGQPKTHLLGEFIARFVEARAAKQHEEAKLSAEMQEIRHREISGLEANVYYLVERDGNASAVQQVWIDTLAKHLVAETLLYLDVVGEL